MAVNDGVPDAQDLGVVTGIVRVQRWRRSPPIVALVTWDDGYLDEVTLHGQPHSSDVLGARRTGARWSRARAKVQMHRALEGELDQQAHE